MLAIFNFIFIKLEFQNTSVFLSVQLNQFIARFLTLMTVEIELSKANFMALHEINISNHCNILLFVRNGDYGPHPDPQLPSQCGEMCECQQGNLRCWRDCPQMFNCPRDANVITDECGCERCDVTSCVWNNVTHAVGSQWSPTPCEVCRCEGGWIICDDVVCPEVSSITLVDTWSIFLFRYLS